MRDIVRDKGLFRKGLIGLAAIIAGCTGYKSNLAGGLGGSSFVNADDLNGVVNVGIKSEGDNDKPVDVEILALGEKDRIILNGNVKINRWDIGANTSLKYDDFGSESKKLISAEAFLTDDQSIHSVKAGLSHKRFSSDSEIEDDNFSVSMTTSNASLGASLEYGHKPEPRLESPVFTADFTYNDGYIELDGEAKLDGEVIGESETVVPYNQLSLTFGYNKKINGRYTNILFDVANETGDGLENILLTSLGASVNIDNTFNLAGVVNAFFNAENDTPNFTLVLGYSDCSETQDSEKNPFLETTNYLGSRMSRTRWSGETSEKLDLIKLLSSSKFENGGYLVIDGMGNGKKPKVTLAGKLKHDELSYLGTVTLGDDYKKVDLFLGVGKEW